MTADEVLLIELMKKTDFDFIVVGAGSSGCAVTAGLVEAKLGTVCILLMRVVQTVHHS